MQESVKNYSVSSGQNPKDIMDLLLVTQYLDMLVAVSSPNTDKQSDSMIINCDPGQVLKLRQSVGRLSHSVAAAPSKIPDYLS